LSSVNCPEAFALKKTLDKILDREACLLPGYFVINEILKAYPAEKDWPHWVIAGSLSSFVANFRPAAQMVRH
jgi:mediator of RNA polymerase II transcription subunit 23